MIPSRQYAMVDSRIDRSIFEYDLAVYTKPSVSPSPCCAIVKRRDLVRLSSAEACNDHCTPQPCRRGTSVYILTIHLSRSGLCSTEVTEALNWMWYQVTLYCIASEICLDDRSGKECRQKAIIRECHGTFLMILAAGARRQVTTPVSNH